MALLPDLKGVATEDQVETIGTGRYAARYINWARTMNTLREHAPGWFVDALPSTTGSRAGTLVHESPVGGYVMLRLVHLDGSATPYVPHAIMDNRRQSIPIDKITSRNTTDAHRRGGCLVIAMQTGLGAELWAKDQLESGFGDEGDEGGDVSPAVSAAVSKTATPPADGKKSRASFIATAIDKGLNLAAAEAFANLVGDENDRAVDYAAGIKSLEKKTAAWVKEQNLAYAPK